MGLLVIMSGLLTYRFWAKLKDIIIARIARSKVCTTVRVRAGVLCSSVVGAGCCEALVRVWCADAALPPPPSPSRYITILQGVPVPEDGLVIGGASPSMATPLRGTLKHTAKKKKPAA